MAHFEIPLCPLPRRTSGWFPCSQGGRRTERQIWKSKVGHVRFWRLPANSAGRPELSRRNRLRRLESFYRPLFNGLRRGSRRLQVNCVHLGIVPCREGRSLRKLIPVDGDMDSGPVRSMDTYQNEVSFLLESARTRAGQWAGSFRDRGLWYILDVFSPSLRLFLKRSRTDVPLSAFPWLGLMANSVWK